MVRGITSQELDISLQDRLSNIESKATTIEDNLIPKSNTSIALSNGVNIYNATKTSSLESIKMTGRTLVNLLGRDGSYESLFGHTLAGTPPVLSTTQKRSGQTSLRCANTGATASYIWRDYDYKLEPTKQYILAAWFYLESHSGFAPYLSICDKGSVNNGRYQMYADTAKIGTWQFVYMKIPKSNTVPTSGFRLLSGYGNTGPSVCYIDEGRIYELSDADYTAIGTTYTGEQVHNFLPYVDDIKHVNAVYIENKGRNLLPDLNDSIWSNAGPSSSSFVITGSYDLTTTVTDTSATSTRACDIPLLINQTYTIKHNGGTGFVRASTIKIGTGGAVVTDTLTRATLASGESFTFTTPPDTQFVRVQLFNINKSDVAVTGTLTYSKPMLNVGSTALPFEPQKPSYLYLPDVQLKSSVDGNTRDELYADGQGKPRAIRRFIETIIDGSLPWVFHLDRTGFKSVAVLGQFPAWKGQNSSKVVKYNGKILSYDGTASTIDSFIDYWAGTGQPLGTLSIAIDDAESGWGETYTPTIDEIKAYFMGWRMTTQESWNTTFDKYNGSGTKGWLAPYCGVGTNVSGWVSGSGQYTLPTTMNPYGYTPYRLVHQLATSVDEPVNYEGALMLHEGTNQVEVGTGIVMREAHVPYIRVQKDVALLNVAVNDPLKYRTNKIMTIYRNGVNDKLWTLYKDFYGTPSANGGASAGMPFQNYDYTSIYSVTYLALDTYALGIAPQTINVEYTPNIRESVESLVRKVVEARTEISVLQNTKAQKQQPQWIAPTLINGWVNFGTGNPTAGYYKDENGIVRLKGIIKSGALIQPAFILPKGYRPIEGTGNNVRSNSSIGFLYVATDGSVIPQAGSNVDFYIDGFTFRAEQ